MNTLPAFVSELLPDQAIVHQSHIGVLQIKGIDAKKFLQGQTTCDFNKLSQEQSLYGAICNIKGRIVSNFFATQSGDDILLLMNTPLVDLTLNHLKKYAVFSKVELTNASEQFRIHATYQKSKTYEAHNILDEVISTETQGGTIQLNISNAPVVERWYVHPVEQESTPVEEENAVYAQVLSLLSARPLIQKEHSEETLPQWLNMQRTGGISFTKGCYTGQEIVARMQYRGKSPKQLALFTWKGERDTSQTLTDSEGKTLGQVFNLAHANDVYVAQVILNQVPEETEHFYLNNQEVSLLPLPYKLTKD